MKLAQPGLLLEGTLNPRDVIPFLVTTLKEINYSAYELVIRDYSGLLEYIRKRINTPSLDHPLAGEVPLILHRLTEELDFCSPSGYTFALREGPRREYGWWPDGTQ